MKQQLRICALTKRSSRERNWLAGVVMCFLYLTKPTVVFSSTFSRAVSPTFYPTLIADEVAAFIYLFPIIKLGFHDSNLLRAEPSVEQQTKQVKQIINLLLAPVIKPYKYPPTLSFSDHTGLQQAGAGHFYQRIHLYPLTVSGSSPFTTTEPDDCTATEASENTQYQREGEQRTFSSFRTLLTIPELWSRFTEYLSVYDSHAELPNDEADAKCVVLNDPKLRKLFLLINDVPKIPLPATRSQGESTGSHTAVASSEAIERQADAATTSRVRNIVMENSLARQFSVMTLSGEACRIECSSRPVFRHAFILFEEGFYYSYAHKQIECFSCGGVLDPEKVRHCSSPRELHGCFYPNCRFLLQQAGEEYVSSCQQSLMDDKRALVSQPLPDDPGLYSEPVSADDIACDLAGAESDYDQRSLQEGKVPGISREEYSKASSEALKREGAEQCESPSHCPGRRSGADCPAPAYFRNIASNDTPARAGNASISSDSDILRLYGQRAMQNICAYHRDAVRAPIDSDTFHLHTPSSIYRSYRVPSIQLLQSLLGTLAHNENNLASFDSDILYLQSALSPESFQALRTLRERIEDSELYHERNRLRQNFLEITNNLNSLPPELCRLVGTEITAMIAAINQADCQDHTSEVLDQMYTRVTFAILRHELQSSQSAEQPVELFDVFDRLKMFFNESVLYKLLGEFELNGEPLAKCRESTEIRSYLKNRFSNICRFPRRNILQLSYFRLSDELLEKIEVALVERTSDQTVFLRYLTDLFSTDTVFLDYIKQNDESFAEQYNDIVATAYSDLERYTSGNPELSDQEVLEGAARVSAGRTTRIAQWVQDYAEARVVEFWKRILENEHLQNRQDHE